MDIRREPKRDQGPTYKDIANDCRKKHSESRSAHLISNIRVLNIFCLGSTVTFVFIGSGWYGKDEYQIH